MQKREDPSDTLKQLVHSPSPVRYESPCSAQQSPDLSSPAEGAPLQSAEE